MMIFHMKYSDKRKKQIDQLNEDKVKAENIVNDFFDKAMDKARLMIGMSELLKSVAPNFLEENIEYHEKMLERNNGFNLKIIEENDIAANVLLKFIEEKIGLKYIPENYQLLNLITLIINIQFLKNKKMYYVNEFKI